MVGWIHHSRHHTQTAWGVAQHLHIHQSLVRVPDSARERKLEHCYHQAIHRGSQLAWAFPSKHEYTIPYQEPLDAAELWYCQESVHPCSSVLRNRCPQFIGRCAEEVEILCWSRTASLIQHLRTPVKRPHLSNNNKSWDSYSAECWACNWLSIQAHQRSFCAQNVGSEGQSYSWCIVVEVQMSGTQYLNAAVLWNDNSLS